MEKSNIDGSIILIDKPTGITSFDVIRRLRKTHGARPGTPEWKMGHAGTLDPLATGLLIVGIGKATKKMHEYIKLPKTYDADILLGTKTDTGDIDGNIIESANVSEIPSNRIYEAIEHMKGTRTVAVPMYSAIKISGKKLYEYAREGDTSVTPPEKTMEVTRITLNEIIRENEVYVLRVTMDVSSGTYIRTLAEELGKYLGVPATIKKLRRTRIGDFDVKDAIPLQ